MIATVAIAKADSTPPARPNTGPTQTAFAGVLRDCRQATAEPTRTANDHGDEQGADRPSDATPAKAGAAPQPVEQPTESRHARRSDRRGATRTEPIILNALLATLAPTAGSRGPQTHLADDAAPASNPGSAAALAATAGGRAVEIAVAPPADAAGAGATPIGAGTTEAASVVAAAKSESATRDSTPIAHAGSALPAVDAGSTAGSAPLPLDAPTAAHSTATGSQRTTIAAQRASSASRPANAPPTPTVSGDGPVARLTSPASDKSGVATATVAAMQFASPAPAATTAIAQMAPLGATGAGATSTLAQSAPTVATASSAALPAAVGSAAWSSQIGQQVVQMVQQGPHDVLLQLHPANLGSLAVHVHLDGQSVQVAFVTQQPQVAQAVQQSLPTLQDALAGAGAQLAGTWVGQQSPRQGWGGRSSREDPERIAPVRQSTAIAASARGDTWGPSTAGTVDFYV